MFDVLRDDYALQVFRRLGFDALLPGGSIDYFNRRQLIAYFVLRLRRSLTYGQPTDSLFFSFTLQLKMQGSILRLIIALFVIAKIGNVSLIVATRALRASRTRLGYSRRSSGTSTAQGTALGLLTLVATPLIVVSVPLIRRIRRFTLPSGLQLSSQGH